jgi:hypothetical protein
MKTTTHMENAQPLASSYEPRSLGCGMVSSSWLVASGSKLSLP